MLQRVLFYYMLSHMLSYCIHSLLFLITLRKVGKFQIQASFIFFSSFLAFIFYVDRETLGWGFFCPHPTPCRVGSEISSFFKPHPPGCPKGVPNKINMKNLTNYCQIHKHQWWVGDFQRHPQEDLAVSHSPHCLPYLSTQPGNWKSILAMWKLSLRIETIIWFFHFSTLNVDLKNG